MRGEAKDPRTAHMEDTIVSSDSVLKEKKRVFIGLDPEQIVWEGFIDQLTEHYILMYVECGSRSKTPMFPSHGKAYVRMPVEGGGLVIFESDIVKPKSADGKLWLLTKPPKARRRQRRAFFRVPYDKPVLIRRERGADQWTDWEEVPLIDVSGGGFSIRYPDELHQNTKVNLFLTTPRSEKIDVLTQVARCVLEHKENRDSQWIVGLMISPQLPMAKQALLMAMVTDLQREILKNRIRN